MFKIQGFFSINVQAVCNAKDVFRWTGSVNDSSILKRSELYRLFNFQLLLVNLEMLDMGSDHKEICNLWKKGYTTIPFLKGALVR
jgi:hypothetical protein